MEYNQPQAKPIHFIGIIALFVMMWTLSAINTIPSLDEALKADWSQVQNQYKRRADLIPNLVKTVQSYADHEKQVFADVAEARSKSFSTNISADNLSDSEKMKEFIDSQNSLGTSISRLLAVAENYPELKANTNFLELQAQLEGCENRIAIARRDYILAVKRFNTALRTFPSIVWAKSLYKDMPVVSNYSESGNENVPTISFS